MLTDWPANCGCILITTLNRRYITILPISVVDAIRVGPSECRQDWFFAHGVGFAHKLAESDDLL